MWFARSSGRDSPESVAAADGRVLGLEDPRDRQITVLLSMLDGPSSVKAALRPEGAPLGQQVPYVVFRFLFHFGVFVVLISVLFFFVLFSFFCLFVSCVCFCAYGDFSGGLFSPTFFVLCFF